MKLPKLTREIIRREDQPDYEPEIWQPSWHCFCCHDTGTVNQHLAKLVVENYKLETDKIPRCQNPGCHAGETLDSLESDMVDYRFTSAICQKLDIIHREDWRQTTQIKAALITQKISEVAKSKSLRQRDRSPEEEQVASRRHQENLILSPKEQDKLRELVYGEDYF
jgi:hypothetical protein